MNSHKTAITRTTLSKPVDYLWRQGLLKGRLLDYGCGKGFDCDWLGCAGLDTYYRPDTIVRGKFDTIYCVYVLNTLRKAEWMPILSHIHSLLRDTGIAYIAVRNDKKNLNGHTSRGTYQCEVNLPMLECIEENSGFKIYKMNAILNSTRG